MSLHSVNERAIDVHSERGPDTRESVQKLAEMIRGIHTAMLTTITAEGHLRTRPMVTQQSELDDELWFFTDARSSLVDDITEHHQVGVHYVDQARQRYVAVSGLAHLIRDRELLGRFWQPEVAQWLPGGPDRDFLALVRVQLEEAEYWDVGSRAMVKLSGFARTEERELPARVPGPERDPMVPPEGTQVLE